MLTMPESSTLPGAERAVPVVLVVDDSPIDRRLAGGILQQRGEVSVIYAQHGAAALEILEREPIALIVTDLQMPELNGLELVSEVRRRFPLVPTILMTAHGSEEIALAALRRGAASYVPKRRLATDLADTVKDVLRITINRIQLQRLHQHWTHTEFQFCLENDAALIPLLVSHLQEYLQAIQHCDETELIRVGVALHEALRNAMHHGNLELDSELRRESPEDYYRLADERREQEPFRGRRVHVTARESPSGACYTIRDEGPGFDLALAGIDPTDSKNLERNGGRGLFLIRTFMHDVRFNECGNEIVMSHRRNAEDPADDAWPAGPPTITQ